MSGNILLNWGKAKCEFPFYLTPKISNYFVCTICMFLKV